MSVTWLRAQIAQLTHNLENNREHPVEGFRRPDEFIAAQLKGIVGVEVPIRAIEGKWKASQNRLTARELSKVSILRVAWRSVLHVA